MSLPLSIPPENRKLYLKVKQMYCKITSVVYFYVKLEGLHSFLSRIWGLCKCSTWILGQKCFLTARMSSYPTLFSNATGPKTAKQS